jgi:hypothetical protein
MFTSLVWLIRGSVQALSATARAGGKGARKRHKRHQPRSHYGTNRVREGV